MSFRIGVCIETTLLATVAAGLIARRRTSYCWSFSVYLLVVLAQNVLVLHWPEQARSHAFYLAKEPVFFALKALIGVEVWQKSFSSLPRARIRVGLQLVVVLAAIAIVTSRIPAGLDPWSAFIGVVNPRWQAGVLLLYATVVANAVWCRLPLHPLHRAILLGFSAYLAVHTCTLACLGWYGGFRWVWRLCRIVEFVAYPCTCAWWAWASWQRRRTTSVAFHQLHPWASAL